MRNSGEAASSKVLMLVGHERISQCYFRINWRVAQTRQGWRRLVDVDPNLRKENFFGSCRKIGKK